MSRRLDGGDQRAEVPALPAPERAWSRRLDGGVQPASTWQSRPKSEDAGFAGAEALAGAVMPALPAPERA